MRNEKELNSSRVNILDITKEYLNGNISFEEYYSFEAQWIERYAGSKSPRYTEETPQETLERQGASDK